MTFEERAKEFTIGVEKLQSRLKIKMIPVITMYGPDLQISDQEEETKQK